MEICMGVNRATTSDTLSICNLHFNLFVASDKSGFSIVIRVSEIIDPKVLHKDQWLTECFYGRLHEKIMCCSWRAGHEKIKQQFRSI